MLKSLKQFFKKKQTTDFTYQLGLAGGTFDHLHKGHEAFLQFIFHHAKKAVIGITSDTYAKDVKQTQIQPYKERKKHVEAFLRENHLLTRAKIVLIEDVYGVSLEKHQPFDVIFSTTDTKKGAEEINAKRKELGLAALHIEVMKLLTAESGTILSSSKIREGVISQTGEDWVKQDWKHHTYELPESLRSNLKKPFGSVLQAIPIGLDEKTIITVGDVTTKLFNDQGRKQKLSIVDFLVERNLLYHSLSELNFTETIQMHHVSNPAGTITSEAWDTIEHALASSDTQVVIEVSGEEDLLVLPCILLSPLGYNIFYGQPHSGLVHVVVTNEVKKSAAALINRFKKLH